MSVGRSPEDLVWDLMRGAALTALAGGSTPSSSTATSRRGIEAVPAG